MCHLCVTRVALSDRGACPSFRVFCHLCHPKTKDCIILRLFFFIFFFTFSVYEGLTNRTF